MSVASRLVTPCACYMYVCVYQHCSSKGACNSSANRKPSCCNPQPYVCHGSQKSSTLGEEVQAALTGNIELTLAMEMKGGWVEMTVAAMYTAASSQAHAASKTCSAHQRPFIQHKECGHRGRYALRCFQSQFCCSCA